MVAKRGQGLKNSKNKSLDNYRKHIDKIDDQLLELLARRRLLIRKIADYKITHQLPIYDRSRESELFHRLIKKAPVHLPESWVQEIFQTLMSLSKKEQLTMQKNNKTQLQVQKIVIVGLGLMGGSLLKALAVYNPKLILYGDDTKFPASAKKWCYRAKPSDLSDADMVILATPVNEIFRFIEKDAPKLKPGCILVDLGSTKKEIVSRAQKKLSPHIHFVGAHPLCGKENGGFINADENLYSGCSVVLCPSSVKSKRVSVQVMDLFEGVGAKVHIMEARAHDELLAVSSHLPQLISIALANLAQRSFKRRHAPLKIMPNSIFQSLTRTASSSYDMWGPVLNQNQEYVHQALELMVEELKRLNLKVGRASMKKEFQNAQKFKEKIIKENIFK